MGSSHVVSELLMSSCRKRVSQTVGIDFLSVEQMSIVGDIRYVCWVEISKVVDFLLKLVNWSSELSYFQILIPEYQRVIPL